MSDLIDRQAALDALKHEIRYGAVIEQCGLDTAFDIVENIPSAEPERKTGEWHNYKDEHCCSVCKCVVVQDIWDDENRYDYCPYCGAEMKK